MRDLKAVLAEKEMEYKRVWSEVTALRYAVKLCDQDDPSPAAAEPSAEPAKTDPAKAWP